MTCFFIQPNALGGIKPAHCISLLNEKAEHYTLDDFTGLSTRPSPQSIGKLQRPFGGIDASLTAQFKTLDPLITEVTKKILTAANGRRVFLFARDGEWLFDALQSLLRHSPHRDRIILVNVSRPIARSSSARQLHAYMLAHGLDIKRVLSGEEEVLFIDTGHRGSIFVQLFTRFAELISGDAAARANQITNLFRNLEAKLLVSKGPGNQAALLAKILENPSLEFSELERTISELYFDELLDAAEIQAAGIPLDGLQRHRWIVNHLEHLPHFSGRASHLTADGKSVQTFEYAPSSDRTKAILLQSVVHEAYAPEKMSSAMTELVTKFEKAAADRSKASVTADRPSWPINLAGIKEGNLLTTPLGRQVEVRRPSAIGRRGQVHQALELKSGQLLALKFAKNREDDTLRSIREESEKLEALDRLGVRYARALETGEDYIVKEWIEGQLASDWLQDWKSAGYPSNAPQIEALRALIEKISSQGRYVGDLNPKNLIWSNQEWVIIDSGSISEMAPADAKARLVDKIATRWSKRESTTTQAKLRAALQAEKPLSYTPHAKPAIKLPPELEALVSSFRPRILFDDLNPLWEELVALKSVTVTSTSLGDRELLNALKIADSVKEPATILFVGNGQFITYLVLKTLFEGTSFADRLVHLPISRSLSEQLNQPGTRDLTELFDFYRLSERKTTLVVFDSTANEKKPNQHSVQRVANHLRKYLLLKGQSFETVRDRVVPLAVNESWDETVQPYTVKSLQEYRKRMKDFAQSDPLAETPSISVPILYGDMVYFPGGKAIVNYYGQGFPIWSDKFVKIGDAGMPVVEKPLAQMPADQALLTLHMRQRMIDVYLDYIDGTRRALEKIPSLRAKVSEVLSHQGL